MIVETDLQREKDLLARWTVKRVQIEHGLQLYRRDPSLPISFQTDLLGEAGMLDRILSLAPLRMSHYGPEGVEVCKSGLDALHTCLEELKNEY